VRAFDRAVTGSKGAVDDEVEGPAPVSCTTAKSSSAYSDMSTWAVSTRLRVKWKGGIGRLVSFREWIDIQKTTEANIVGELAVRLRAASKGLMHAYTVLYCYGLNPAVIGGHYGRARMGSSVETGI
jgi:hypothetical protein